MGDYKNVLVERVGKVMIITLNRPQAMNALNTELLLDLHQAYKALKSDSDVWIGVLMGAGRCFCGGADVKEMAGGLSPEAHRKRQIIREAGEESGIPANCEKPMIAAVHGYCLGAALSMALSCDMIVAAEGTKFAVSEVKRGLPPTQVLARTFYSLPHKLAMEMNLTGDFITAEKALQYGMVNEVVPQPQLRESALKLADRVLAAAPLAVRAAKKKGWLITALAREETLLVDVGRIAKESEDLKEGLAAFVEKRKPQWRAR